MKNNTAIYSAGKFRVVNIPSIGSYNLVTGMGYPSGTYAKSPWAFACMDIRATALAQIPWEIKRDDKVLDDHPLIELLDGWGPEMNWADAFKATEFDMLLMGAAYWLKDGNLLSRLNPNTMKVVVKGGKITGFEQRIYTAGREEKRNFARDEVVYFREYHPTDDLGPGVAAMDVAKNAVLAEYESGRYIKAFFENDAVPGLLIRTEQDVPPQELNRLASWWKERFQGAKNARKVAFVDKGLEAQILTTDLRAMALEEVRDQARRDICTAFRVPMTLVGDLDAANFATAHEARMTLYQEVILPRADYYADVLNAELVPEWDESVQFSFNAAELPALQEDKDKKATRLAMLLDKNAITVEYLREELNIPETAGPTTEQIEAKQREEFEMSRPQTIRAWRKKALKALKRGESANVPFETEDVTPSLQEAIRVRLADATTEEQVRAVFA